MKRGTAAKVILGKDTLMDVPAGIVHGTDVILGGKAGLLNDFGGLVLSNNLMIGKKVSRGTITTVTVRGVAPIILPDAIAGSLQAVRAFGGTEQNGTPTPDAPVDIVSNNGVLKATRPSGLPTGYIALDYISFSGAQYIDTGLAINNNTRVLFDAKKSTSSAQANYPWLGGVRDYVNNTNINKKTLEFSKSDSTKMYLQYATSGEITLAVPNTTQRHTYDFDKNKLYVDEDLIYTATQETFTGNATFLIGTVYYGGSVSTASMFYGDVYGFKLWQDGTNLSMNLIPAKRNSDNVIGMYDLVSGQFFTNQGTGDFVAGPNAVDPITIVTDGTVETIQVHSTNVFNKNATDALLVGFPANDGKWVELQGFRAICCKLLEGKTYTITRVISNPTSSAMRVIAYDKVPTANYYGAPLFIGNNTTKTATITVPTGSPYIVTYVKHSADSIADQDLLDGFHIELGETALDYQPYFDGGTATAEMLLKVGDYQDEQEILSGAVTRKVGVKVFDGTESWSSVSGGNIFGDKNSLGMGNALAPSSSVITTITGNSSSNRCMVNTSGYVIFYYNWASLGVTTKAEAKQWFADQYAAGTPVIVLYPLATPTTETVTGQTLQVTAGDNVLEITQASLDGLELEATYKSLVQLTIQEVEDANLNNNVEVTIS